MLTDRLTARILGLVLIVFAIAMNLSMLVLTSPEARARPGFLPLLVIPTVPVFLLGIAILVRGRKLPRH